MDPWVITPPERAKHMEHFKGLNPVAGMVSGNQAKGFLMQSQLPPLVLAQIWGLADADKDGSLNFNEFSIACKLITMKLKGFELPKTLTPALASALASPTAAVAPPVMPLATQNSVASPLIMPGVAAPLVQPVPQATTVAPIVPGFVPQAPVVPLIAAAPAQPSIATIPLVSGAPPMMPGVPNMSEFASVAPGIVPAPIVSAGVAPGVPASLPQQLSRKASVTSQDSSPVVDWPVPQPSKLKYTQIFNQVDRSKTGFMNGMQARQLLVQTGLNHSTLAKVWSLADIDGDGRLSCEEFILAMHLTDMVKRGEQLPVKLTPELVPPTFRRMQQQQRRMSGAAVGITPYDAGTPSLISADGSGTPGSIGGDETGFRIPGLGTDMLSQDGLEDPATFEDKRKENFDRGQAELERRRRMLQEQQQRELEERQRKEREEMERLERMRQEIEAKKQAELEKQLQRQRELEEAREEERKRVQEQRETARKEMERQRQLEWEKQRRQELLQQRQREQEKVVHLKAQSQRLAAELEQMDGKIKELTDKVADTRSAVIAVKGTIDGMRETRDEKIDEMNKYKKLLMEHQQRMMVVVQEKAKLSERNRMNIATAPDGNAMAATFAKKQAAIQQLKEKLEEYKTDEDEKLNELQTHHEQLAQAKTQLTELLHNKKNLISSFRDKRVKIVELREKEKKERLKALLDPKAAWGDDVTPIDEPPAQEAWAEAVPMPDPGTLYRALYDFEQRNPDELSFYAGDVISITEAGSHEAGWFHGVLDGRSGWFPESYVELVPPEEAGILTTAAVPDGDVGEAAFAAPAAPAAAEVVEEDAFAPVDSFAPVKPEPSAFEPVTDGFNGSDFVPSQINGSSSYLDSKAAEPSGGLEPDVVGYCVALYAYESAEPGDLTFQQGDTIRLLKDEGDWWTGYLYDPNNTGVFPANYVEKIDQPPKGKKLEVAKVIAPYTAASADQLNLQRGQLVQIRKKSSSGWWEGELQAKGQKKQVGWFPGTYVKILVGSRSGSAASSTRTSPLPKEMFDLPPREQVIALYSYVAQNGDELSFEKGDQISIVSKDEKDWWKGELKTGEVGLFPANYVEALRGPDPVNSVENGTNHFVQPPAEEEPEEDEGSHFVDIRALPALSAEERKRQECIRELIATEQAYVSDMAIVKEVFEKPLMRAKALTEMECMEVFVNWDDLHHCNNKLLRAMRVRRKMSGGGVISMIGDILCENLPNMTLYIRYCACQLKACHILQRKKEENLDFEEVHRQCVANPRSNGMPLSSFLLKPTQRITRYPLLFKNILKNTPVGHPDRQYMEEAVQKAEELCSQVNEGVRERENSDTLEWIQLHVSCKALSEKITFNSVTNLLGPRRCLYHGPLNKSKSGKELVGFLFNDFLLLATPDRPGSAKNLNLKRSSHVYFNLYRTPLFLNEVLVEKSGEDFAEDSAHFVVKTLNQVVGLKATNSSDKHAWVKRIKAAADAYSSAETSLLRRQASEVPAKGRVLVGVLGGVDLCPGKYGKCDPFCEVTMGSQVHRTKVINGSTSPRWNASMQFIVKDLAQDVLCLSVYDKDLFSPDEFLGRTEMRICDVMEETGCTRGPVLKRLPLYEVKTGAVEVKFDLQLFHRGGR